MVMLNYRMAALVVLPLALMIGMWAMAGAGFVAGRSRALVSYPAVCAWSDPPPGVATCPERPR